MWYCTSYVAALFLTVYMKLNQEVSQRLIHPYGKERKSMNVGADGHLK